MIAVYASLVVAAAVVAAAASRRWSRRRAADAIERARSRATDAAGVVVGAGSIHLQAPTDRGVLLLHGFNDTPQSVAPVAHALHARGWTVSAPLLPGHGRADDELERTGRGADWIDYVRSEWESFRARVPRAVLCGQSMGGAIAVIIAVEAPPRALVLLAPYLSMGRLPRLGAAVWRLGQLFVPVLVSDGRRAMRDEAARERSLGRGVFNPRLVAELKRVVNAARRALPSVRVPTLTVHSRGDYRIPSKSARHAFAELQTTDKTIVWRDDAGHVLAADRGHDELAAMIGAWLDERVPPG